MRSSLIMDPIDDVPSVAGPGGRAWEIDLAARRMARQRLVQHTEVAPPDAAVALWLIEAPQAHPIWHSYHLVLVHLRATPALREPIIYLPGATHELWLNALDPSVPRAPIHTAAAVILTPMNFAAQIVAEDDAAARGRVLDAVGRVCAGTLNPDTDAVRQWMALFGDNMMLDKEVPR